VNTVKSQYNNIISIQQHNNKIKTINVSIVLIIVHCKTTTYGKITLKSMSLNIDILHIKLFQNLFNHNYLLHFLLFSFSFSSSSSSCPS